MSRNGNPSELAFGIMCRGTEFDDWAADCIGRLCAMEDVEPELLIVQDTATDDDGEEESGSGGLGRKLSTLLEYRERTGTRRAINKASWFLYGLPFDGPSSRATTDLSAELAGVDRIHCGVEQDGFSQYFSDDDLAAIEAYDLDFVLRFAYGIIRGEIHDVPEYGVWSFHHDDERKYRGAPPCFWEIYEDDPVTGAVLQRLTDRLDGGVILKRGFFPTRRTYRTNFTNVSYGAAEWPAQVATDILNGNAGYVDDPPTPTDAPIYRPPSPLQLLWYTLTRGYALGAAAIGGVGHWNVGVVDGPIRAFVEEGAAPGVDWFPDPGRDRFVADPFPVEIDGRQYVFVEDFSLPEWKGKISYVEYPEGFEDGEFRTAHEEPFHMSYPNLFTHDGVTYALPETHEANEVRLYRVTAPDEWTVEATLLPDVAGVDPTVVERDGRWWMFLTERAYSNTKLHVWHAPALAGEWEPHANNPVKTDVRSARPGGTPFVADGELYRPAQNCAGGYGESIAINRVDTLTTTRYAEERARTVRPAEDGRFPEGMHTLSSNGELTLIDGKRRVRNRHALKRRGEYVVSKLLP